jgi:uncharacterized membrane protein YedE/YeeE
MGNSNSIMHVVITGTGAVININLIRYAAWYSTVCRYVNPYPLPNIARKPGTGLALIEDLKMLERMVS